MYYVCMYVSMFYLLVFLFQVRSFFLEVTFQSMALEVELHRRLQHQLVVLCVYNVCMD